MFENYEGIIIDLRNTRKDTRKILCVIDKSQLEYITERTYKCPQCHNKYFLDIEILKNDDVLESVHQDENIELKGIQGINEPVLLTADDIDFSSETNDNEEKKSGFYSFDYLKKSGVTITDIEENIPSAEEDN
jgi:hypothetical protein